MNSNNPSLQFLQDCIEDFCFSLSSVLAVVISGTTESMPPNLALEMKISILFYSIWQSNSKQKRRIGHSCSYKVIKMTFFLCKIRFWPVWPLNTTRKQSMHHILSACWCISPGGPTNIAQPAKLLFPSCIINPTALLQSALTGLSMRPAHMSFADKI